jgi:hypothetical protein
MDQKANDLAQKSKGIELKKALLSACISFVFITSSDAYFSDENSPKANRILWGGGIRDPLGMGVEFQRNIVEGISASGALGFFFFDGFHGSIGANYLWRDTKRFRPIGSLALSYVGGLGPLPGKVLLNGEESEFKIEEGIFSHFAGGFQFRLWKGLGLQYQLGWRQAISGGGYELISSTDPKIAKDVLDGMTGSGIMFGARGFWEL